MNTNYVINKVLSNNPDYRAYSLYPHCFSDPRCAVMRTETLQTLQAEINIHFLHLETRSGSAGAPSGDYRQQAGRGCLCFSWKNLKWKKNQQSFIHL